MVADFSVHDLQQSVEHDACAQLGRDRWNRAYAAGRTASIETLIDEIDARCR
jgi:hypothetical protein